MDVDLIPDVIAAGTRVSGGGVEGKLISAHRGFDNFGTIEHEGGTTDVALDAIELVERIDPKKVAAYHKAADAAALANPAPQTYTRQPGEA